MNRILMLTIVCLLALPATTLAQTRSRTTRRSTQSSKTPKASEQQAAAEAKTAGAMKVADQVKNLTKFLYILGGVAKGIEDTSWAAWRKESRTSTRGAAKHRLRRCKRTNRTKRRLNPVLRTFA